MCLNIATLWSNILAESWNGGNTFTTEMERELITTLKILNSLLSTNIPASVIQAVCQVDGTLQNVQIVGKNLIEKNAQNFPEHSAQELVSLNTYSNGMSADIAGRNLQAIVPSVFTVLYSVLQGLTTQPVKSESESKSSASVAEGILIQSLQGQPSTVEKIAWQKTIENLRPNAEIIVLAMAPLDGTFAENALKHGVAGLNIDGGRVGTDISRGDRYRGKPPLGEGSTVKFGKRESVWDVPKGRYPSNLLLSHSPECRQTGVKKVKGSGTSKQFHKGYEGESNTGFIRGVSHPGNQHADSDGTETVPAYECVEGCAVKMLDEQAGPLKSGDLTGQPRTENMIYGSAARTLGKPRYYKGDSGSASRFFYTAKSSRSEREAGLKGHIPCVKCGGLDTDFHLDDKGDKVKCVRNDHPTVKPQAILDYLCKLTMTPTGGVVLDMFGGTGTTALACENIGRKCILIEKEKKSCDIAVARLKGLTKQGRLWDA